MGDGKLTWLHLSDFHFGKSKDWQMDVVLQALERDVIDTLAGQGLQPDLVFITGDIADKGKTAEYDMAQTWFRSMADKLGHDPRQQWFLVPGNHDVDRGAVTSLSKTMRSGLSASNTNEILSDPDSWRRFSDRQAGFLKFTHDFLGRERAWQPETPWQAAYREIAGFKLALLCLNSAWACQDDEDKGEILLGEFQLRQALAEAEEFKPNLTLALFHHPLEDLKAFDRKACDGIFKSVQGCHLLLRGHLHDTDVNFTLNPGGGYLELAAGACWQDANHPHGVMVVQLDPADRKGTVHSWTWDPKKGGFWKPDNLYPNMDNGRWRFDFPADWLRPTQPKSRKEPPPMPTAPPLIPAAYGRFLRGRYSNLETLAEAEAPLLFKLLKIYVPLETDWEAPAERETRRRVLENQSERKKKKRSPSGDPAAEALKPTRRPLIQLLATQQRHFLVPGPPGSGKSTFLRYAALTELDAAQPRLPLLLQLKDFGTWLQQKPGSTPELLLDWAAAELATFGITAAALAHHGGRGLLIWFLDGLDEIFHTEARLRAAEIIGKWFAGPGSGDRLLVTTRPHALQQQGIRAALNLEHQRAPVLSLSRETQAQFLKNWFFTLYGRQSEDRAEELRKHLWEALEYHDNLQEIRGNPLLLSTIATIYHQGKRLPDRRADLYGQAVNLLLGRRFGPTAGGDDGLVRQMKQALMLTARRMQERGLVREDLAECDFIDYLKEVFYPEQEHVNAEARARLEGHAVSLGSHSGLLAMSGAPPRYRFPHLGFQEYLAARCFSNERNPIEALAPHLEKGSWQEVILLTAGCLFESGVSHLGEDFIDGLRQRIGTGQSSRGSLTLTMLAAAEAPSDAVPNTVTAALTTAARAILEDRRQPYAIEERIALAQALGRLGDPRLGMACEDRWVEIPAGRFPQGSENEADEQPVHEVTITRPFRIGRFPVTNQEYAEFVADGGYQHRAFWSERGWAWREGEQLQEPANWRDGKWNGKNQPVVGVSWFEAEAYCRWLNAFLRKEAPEWWQEEGLVRLPTEAEWEAAARGKTGRSYPWGETKPDPNRANYDESKIGKTTPVGIYGEGVTPEGLWDMAGNVLEWCLDGWDPEAYKRREQGVTDPLQVAGEGEGYVLRGGSWALGSGWLPASARGRSRAGWRSRFVGFRCVVSGGFPA